MGGRDEGRTIGDGPRHWFVTGAAGFIGSNLCRYLLSIGASVTAMDNFFTGKPGNVERLAALGRDRFRFVEGSVLDSNAVAEAAGGAESVVHLAAQVSVQRSIDDPRETHDINTTGFLNVLDAARAVGASRFVYASSCAVYGDNPNLPLREAEPPTPLSPYAATKLANENYAAGFAGGWSNPIVTGLRFFNIFGAWQDAGGGYAAVIPKWIDALMNGAQPVLFGDGSAVRDFCHVDNVCDAIWNLCQSERSSAHNVFNIGTGERTRLDMLFGLIRRLLGERGVALAHEQPRFEPWRAGDILESVADVGLAETEIGFRAAVDLEEGIRRLLEEEYGLR